MNVYWYLTVFSSTVVAATIFIIVYILSIREDSQARGIMLSGIILAVSLRLCKSLLYFFFPDLSVIGVALGFGGCAIAGPLYYLYVQDKNLRMLKPLDFLHFLFATVGTFAILLSFDMNRALYITAGVSLAGYAAYGLYILSSSETLSRIDQVLGLTLLVLAIVFVLQGFSPSIGAYATGTFIGTIAIYTLFYFMLKNPRALAASVNQTTKKKVKEEHRHKVLAYLTSPKCYGDSEMTLSSFSDRVSIPKYIITQVVSDEYQMSFPEVINAQRVKLIIERLKNPDSLNDKIESMAYDAGFNTMSRFYAAFKKETNMSPRNFQKRHLSESHHHI